MLILNNSFKETLKRDTFPLELNVFMVAKKFSFAPKIHNTSPLWQSHKICLFLRPFFSTYKSYKLQWRYFIERRNILRLPFPLLHVKYVRIREQEGKFARFILETVWRHGLRILRVS